MSNYKNVLDDFINQKSSFLDFPDGEEKLVKFVSVEPVITNFKGKETPCLRYRLEIDGNIFMWDRTSRELAKQMRQFTEGDQLRIRREGERNQTKYFIQKVIK